MPLVADASVSALGPIATESVAFALASSAVDFTRKYLIPVYSSVRPKVVTRFESASTAVLSALLASSASTAVLSAFWFESASTAVLSALLVSRLVI